METSNAILDYDTSHIYTGHIYGKLNLKRTLIFSTQGNLQKLKEQKQIYDLFASTRESRVSVLREGRKRSAK